MITLIIIAAGLIVSGGIIAYPIGYRQGQKEILDIYGDLKQ